MGYRIEGFAKMGNGYRADIVYTSNWLAQLLGDKTEYRTEIIMLPNIGKWYGNTGELPYFMNLNIEHAFRKYNETRTA